MLGLDATTNVGTRINLPTPSPPPPLPLMITQVWVVRTVADALVALARQERIDKLDAGPHASSGRVGGLLRVSQGLG